MVVSYGFRLVYKQGIHYKNTSSSRGVLVTVPYPIAIPSKTLLAIRTTYNEGDDGSSHWNRDTRNWTTKSLDMLIDYGSHCKDYIILVVGI